MNLFLVIILCVCFYIIGKENGNEETTKLIKQYWEEATDINDFLYKFSILWKRNVGE